MDHDPRRQKSDRHIQHCTEQGHFQISQSPEESLDHICRRRHKIHKRNQLKIRHTQPDDLLRSVTDK